MNILLVSNKNFDYIELIAFALILLFIYDLFLNFLLSEKSENSKNLDAENNKLKNIIKEKDDLINKLQEFSYRSNKYI